MTTHYRCASGDAFSASFSPERVVIRTVAGLYRLPRRGGSLERYGSESVAFIRDEDAGVLVGADGGQFNSCVVAEGALKVQKDRDHVE